MNRYEKIAWFNLVVCAVSIVLYCILFLLLRMKFDVFMSAKVATAAFAVVAITAFGPLVFHRTGAIIDERGAVIWYKRKYAYLLFLGVYLSIFIGIWVGVKFVGNGSLSHQVTVLIVFAYVTIVGLIAVTSYLYWKKQKESRLKTDDQNAADVFLFGPDMDERDLQIQRSARWCGFGVFWLVYVFGLMGTWAWFQHRGIRTISLDIGVVPLFVFGPVLLILVVDSITSVILYRRGR